MRSCTVCRFASLAVVLLVTLGACQKFSAGGSAGDAGEAGAAGEAGHPQGGAAGSAGSVSSSAGSMITAGAAGMVMSFGGAAGMASGGSVGSGGGAGASAGAPPVSECPCAAPTPSCEAGRCVARGPAMIKADGYFIDSTEVTAAQYAIFAKLKGNDTSGQPAECSWNTSFDPVFEPGATLMLPNRPVTNIDFCDAKAYCAWADKRLCGNISGGPLQLPETADPLQSQWFAACAGPKSQLYPYGAAHQDGVCNDSGAALLDVSAKTQCQGYYPGLYDMLGNAQEWVDSCDVSKGKTDTCERIGGSYATGTGVTCNTSGAAERGAYSQSVGFRCCSVAKPAKPATKSAAN